MPPCSQTKKASPPGGRPGGDVAHGHFRKSATLNGARAIGIAADYGTVEVGKIADLIVLDADPTVDIRNLRRVRTVIKGGTAYPREP